MKVELKKLKPNPFRDFKVDPIDPEAVKALVKSIEENTFWSGVIARKIKGGDIQIAAGHTRTYAAMEAGVTHADITVGNFDDQAMIRIYATENATQRGNSGLAMMGSVASAVRYLVKAILKGDEHFSQIWEKSSKALDSLRGNIANDRGLGAPIIERFLTGIPGVNKSMITHQIANLKASGDYARIVKEVTEEIAQEQAVELAELKRREEAAEKATTKEEAEKAEKEVEKMSKTKTTRDTSEKAAAASNGKKPVFDLAGVGKWLKTENQIRAFRTVVERDATKKHLLFENQALLAEKLVAYAAEKGKDLSAEFITDHMTWQLVDIQREQNKLDKQAQEELEKENAKEAWKRLSHQFARNMQGACRDGVGMLTLLNDHRDLKLQLGMEVKSAIKRAAEVTQKLARAI